MVQSQGHKEKLLCSLSIPEEGCLWFLVWRFCLNVWHSGEDILIIPVTAKAKRISWMFKHFKNTKKRQQAEVHYSCKKKTTTWKVTRHIQQRHFLQQGLRLLSEKPSFILSFFLVSIKVIHVVRFSFSPTA